MIETGFSSKFLMHEPGFIWLIPLKLNRECNNYIASSNIDTNPRQLCVDLFTILRSGDNGTYTPYMSKCIS